MDADVTDIKALDRKIHEMYTTQTIDALETSDRAGIALVLLQCSGHAVQISREPFRNPGGPVMWEVGIRHKDETCRPESIWIEETDPDFGVAAYKALITVENCPHCGHARVGALKEKATS